MKFPGIILCFLVNLLISSGFSSCNSPREKVSPRVKNAKPETGTITGKTDTVEISAMKFVPEIITVSPGTTIVFINNDLVAHDVTEEATNAWSSKSLAPAKSWSMIAGKSADYFCSIHVVMKGKIVVVP